MTNCNTSPPPAAARAERPQDTSRRRDTRDAEDFERLLRGKRGLLDDPCDEEDTQATPAAAEAPPVPPPTPWATALAQRQEPVAPAALPAARGVVVEASPTVARMDLLATQPAAAGSARAFEVSLNEPMGVSIAVRVTQPEAAIQAAAASRWSLSIGASNLNPAALKRHSGRLDERLRQRGLSHEPLNFDNDEQ